MLTVIRADTNHVSRLGFTVMTLGLRVRGPCSKWSTSYFHWQCQVAECGCGPGEGGELSSCESGAPGAVPGRGLGRREYRGQRCGPTRLPRVSATFMCARLRERISLLYEPCLRRAWFESGMCITDKIKIKRNIVT